MKREALYEGKVIQVVKLEDRWEVVEHVPAVSVLVLRDAPTGTEVLGVRQNRPAIQETSWELPAGLVDEGETPEEAALRELAEEVGLTGTLTPIAQVHSSPGFTTEKVYLFEATDLQERALEGDEDDLTLEWRDLKATWREIASGRLASSAHTLLGLTYALGRRGQL